MRVQALLERGVANDQRRYARVAVHVSAGLVRQERPTTHIIVTDLSSGGCGFELDSHVDVGARVWLKLPGLESWCSRVVWFQDGRGGLAFDRPLHQAVVDRYR
jgi:hypothetical protein